MHPQKTKSMSYNRFGRIERKDKDKTTPIVYDFVDKDIYYQKAFKTRKTIYRKNNNEILEEKKI